MVNWVNFFKRINTPAARLAIFILFFWFGVLKVLDLSPATPLVQNLFEQTMPFMSFGLFLVLFGLFEMLIGTLFLIKGLEKWALSFLVIHLIMTASPLALLPDMTWSGFMVPTMEGQYIIKNILILALGISIAASLQPAKILREII